MSKNLKITPISLNFVLCHSYNRLVAMCHCNVLYMIDASTDPTWNNQEHTYYSTTTQHHISKLSDYMIGTTLHVPIRRLVSYDEFYRLYEELCPS